MITNIPIFIELSCQIMVSFLIGSLVTFFTDDSPMIDGFIIGIGIILLLITSRLARNLGNFHVESYGLSVKCALLKIVNKKLCKLSHEVINSSDITSKITNLVSTYVQAYDFLAVISYFLLTPFLTVVVFISINYYAGYPGVLGMLLILISSPIQTKLAHWSVSMKSKSSKFAEQRIKKTSEMFETIRLLKIYS